MGILDKLGVTILATYKGNTKPLQRAIRDLRGEERKRAQELKKQIDDQNEDIDEQIKKWGKVVGAIAGVVVAIKGAQKAFNTYAEDVRLNAAIGQSGIDGLRKATEGLINNQELLAFKAKLANGAFAISEKQMEAVARAVVVLRNEGNDLTQVMDKVSQALIEGNVESLKEFGIQAKGTSDTVEGFNGVMDALNEKASKTPGSLKLAGDSMRQESVKFQNAMRNIEISIGKIVVALEPLVSLVAKLVEGIARDIDTLAIRFSTDRSIEGREYNRQYLEKQGELARIRSEREFRERQKQEAYIASLPSQIYATSPYDFKGLDPAILRKLNQKKKRTGRRRTTQPGLLERAGAAYLEATDLGSALELAARQFGLGPDQLLATLSGTPSGPGRQYAAASGRPDLSINLSDQEKRGKRELLLEQIFGPLDANIAYMEGLRSVVQAATTSTVESFAAVIEGSKSLKDAYKSIAVAAIDSAKAFMLVEAAKQLGLGIAAFFSPASSAKHFAAAAALTAGAGLAGRLSSSLGGSGGSQAEVPRLGTGSVSTGGGGDRSITVLIADDFAGESQGARRNRIRSAIEEGKQALATDAVEFS